MDEKTKGFKYNFTTPPPEYLYCQDCEHVARDATITICCGRTFCQSCIDRIKKKGDPCPSCAATIEQPIPQLWYRETTTKLRVECLKKDRGCDWEGMLKDLHTHLDEANGTCMFVEVFCRRGCGVKVERKYVEAHLNNVCVERDFSCHYCNKTGTFREISNEHWAECASKPVQCPNKCNFTCKQNELEEHLDECSLTTIKCHYQPAGCTEEFLRKNEEAHLEKNTQQHLKLSMAMCLKLKDELKDAEHRYEKSLEEQAQVYAEKLQAIEKQQAESYKLHEDRLHTMYQEYEQKLSTMKHNYEMVLHGKDESMKLVKEKMDSIIDSRVRKQIEPFKQILGILPYNFTMPEFCKLKQNNELWYSPKMLTHYQGYTFLISVRANGYGSSKDKSVGVWLRSVKGHHDKNLKWPGKVTITLQLLNQFHDFDHVTLKKSFQLVKASDQGPAYIDEFSPDFISHQELNYNASKQTQYLKEDCIKFRITAINLQ